MRTCPESASAQNPHQNTLGSDIRLAETQIRAFIDLTGRECLLLLRILALPYTYSNAIRFHVGTKRFDISRLKSVKLELDDVNKRNRQGVKAVDTL